MFHCWSSTCVDSDTQENSLFLSQERVWERPGNEATQTSHLHAHLHKTQRKLDVNLGASQVNYITYSIVRFLLFSQFVLTIISVVSLLSGEKTTGNGATSPLWIYTSVCVHAWQCVRVHLCIHICVCYITTNNISSHYVHTTIISAVLLSLAQQSGNDRFCTT